MSFTSIYNANNSKQGSIGPVSGSLTTGREMSRGARMPVSRLLIGTLLVNSTLSSILDARHLFNLPLFGEFVGWRYIWRLCIWQTAYGSTGEILVGMYSLYNLRIVEKFMGSKKFAALVATSYATTSLLVPIVNAVLYSVTGWPGLDTVPGGLTPTLFALLFSYHALVPAVPSLQLSLPGRSTADNAQQTMQVTTKWWFYGVAMHLATCRYPGSLVSAITGWVVGALYHSCTILPASWHLPPFLASVLVQNSTCTTMNRRQRRPGFRTRESPVGLNGAQTRRSDTVAAASQPPSESDVQTIMSMMNVNQEVATQALAATGNSLERAVENLLSG